MRKFIAPPLFALLFALPVYADAIVASWNIEHLGWDNGKDLTAVAEVGSRFDLIALQEVMSEEGAADLVAALEARTGARWDSLFSHAVGRGSYKEFYAFLYRTDTITWIDGAVIYLDDRDVFAREPFSARFETADGFQFVMTSVHSIYAKSVAEREAEAVALRSYLDWLNETFEGSPVFLAGDFNLPPTNPAWDPVGQIAAPLITQGATTISTKDGRFANLYDNIWAPRGMELPIHAAGSLEFPHQILGITHEEARDQVSDHIPVWMWLSPAAEPVLYPASEIDRGQFDQSSYLSSASGTQDEALPPVIGNRNSKIYHLPHCPGYSKTSAKICAGFPDEAQAAAGGFRKARNR